MSARQAVIDVLKDNPQGLDFYALQSWVRVPSVLLESLLSNMRRNQVIRCTEGKWFLYHHGIAEPDKVIPIQSRRTRQSIPPCKKLEKLKSDVSRHLTSARKIRERIKQLESDYEELAKAIEDYERSAGIST